MTIIFSFLPSALPLVALFSLCAGCAMTKIPAYTSSAPSVEAIVRETAGLRVAVDPFFDRERTEQYFRVHAFKDGIAIIHLRVANTGSPDTVLVNKDDFKMLLGGSDEGTSATAVNRETAAGEAVALTGAALGSLPMLFAGAKLLSDATVVRHNFTSKEFRTQTLSPGETAEGFLYFQFDKKKHRELAGTFLFAVRHPRTQQTETLHFPLVYAK
jgi:hypothetical protein